MSDTPIESESSVTETQAPNLTPPPLWERAAIEKLLLANLREQAAQRKWKMAGRLLWMLFIAGILWFVFSASEESTPSTHKAEHTAVINIKGEIGSETEASAEKVISSLKTAFEDTNAKAVVLLINSPGGSPVQAGIINDEIRRLKTKHKKKVYAVTEEMCASAAYYIAVAADEIYADKASLVGSIGVLMDGFGFVDLMKKLGVERRLMTAGTNKALGDPFSPENPEHKAYLQKMLADVHQQFIKVVEIGRGNRLKITPETFSGLVWSGDKAVHLGLIDGLGNVDYVARELIKAEDLVDYTYRENVGVRLAKRLGASIGEGFYRMAANQHWSFQ